MSKLLRIQSMTGENEITVLFLDDEEAILSALRSLLRKEPYNKVYFNSPSNALEYLSSNKVDLIVSDLKIGNLAGEEFLKKSTQINPNAIKIILSTFEDKASVLEMLAAGTAHYYLMKPWEETELKNTIKKFSAINSNLEKKKLSKYINNFSKLPAPTDISTYLMRLLNDDMINVNRISAEIEYHPFIVAKLLQIVNSASFGLRKELTSIREAVLIIGITQLKELIVSFELYRSLGNLIDSRFNKTINSFWHKSLTKAIIAKKVAEKWERKVDNDLVFISALMSDIGYLVWLYKEPENFNAFLELQKAKLITVSEAEQNLFLFEHTKLGAVLLQLWNLPSKVIEAVENHHMNHDTTDLVKIIQIADLLEGSGNDSLHDPSIEPLAAKYKELLKV